MAHAWKVCIGVTLSWVRIPPSPPQKRLPARGPFLWQRQRGLNPLVRGRSVSGDDRSAAKVNPTVSARSPSAGVRLRARGLIYLYKNCRFTFVAARLRSQPSGQFYGVIYGIAACGDGTLQRLGDAFRCQDTRLKTVGEAL